MSYLNSNSLYLSSLNMAVKIYTDLIEHYSHALPFEFDQFNNIFNDVYKLVTMDSDLVKYTNLFEEYEEFDKKMDAVKASNPEKYISEMCKLLKLKKKMSELKDNSCIDIVLTEYYKTLIKKYENLETDSENK